jgi:hypothetical protein
LLEHLEGAKRQDLSAKVGVFAADHRFHS